MTNSSLKRLILLMILMCSFSLIKAQAPQLVSLNLENASLSNVFSVIEKQTTYRFAYRNVIIDKSRNITISKRNVSVTSILQEILAPKYLEFSVISNKFIVISERKSVYQQVKNIKKKIVGKITDSRGEPIIGADIIEKATKINGTITDINGDFTIDISGNSSFTVSYIGYVSETFTVNNRSEFIVILKEYTELLDEVVIVGYGSQRKVSVVGALTTINPSELKVGGVSSVSNALAGRVAGLIGVQTSGEPGKDMSELWIRGVGTFGANSSPLVLIDGIDRGTSALNDIVPEDVESFTILKDASATAVYGARGANGVVLVNTRHGVAGEMTVDINVKSMIEELPRLPNYLGAYDYAVLANEARAVRGDKSLYSPEIYDIIKYQMDPDLYPDVNWQKEVLKEQTWGTQANVNISGGGKTARYYMSGFFRTNDAIYKQTGMDRYNRSVRRKQYSFRTNVDVNATKSTVIGLSLHANLVVNTHPGFGNTDSIWSALANLTPMTVPVRYSNGQLPAYGKGGLTSPAVLLNETGFVEERDNVIESLLKIEQDLKFITDGLKLTGIVSFDNFNNHVTERTKIPDLYIAIDRNWYTGALMTEKKVEAVPLQFVTSSYGVRTIYFEAKLDYNKVFANKHRVSGLFLYNQRTEYDAKLASIPYKNQGVAGRVTYSFDDIYFIEGNFGYNGSENFPRGERYGFFPSVAFGYVLSNYKVVQKTFPFLDLLKLRASYGLVGNDQISNDVRFPYFTTIDMNAPGYIFGDHSQLSPGGVTEAVLGSTGLVWEKAKKMNIGIDLDIWNSLSITADFFTDNRSNIFMQRATLPGTTGVDKKPWDNVGEMKSWGTDGSISYTRSFGDVEVGIRGNYTLTHDEILEYDELIPFLSYQGRKGMSSNITRGLIALGLFKDEDDVKNSPTQFGKVLPGDIKYQDVNGDGKIDDYDIIPIGNSGIPKFQYGASTTVVWKGFDMNAFFRGAAGVAYFMGGSGFYPFAKGKTGNVLTIANIQKNRWTPASYSGDPSTENLNARFPRLTYGKNVNNNRNSTFWLADASYLRFKTLEIGYSFSKKILKHTPIEKLRFSILGDNLHVWDKIEFWDPEQVSSNGAVYPLTRSYSIVLEMSF